jgi:hypothetical protein
MTVPPTVAEEVVLALMDVLAGHDAFDVQTMSSLPLSRCVDIVSLKCKLLGYYGNEWRAHSKRIRDQE